MTNRSKDQDKLDVEDFLPNWGGDETSETDLADKVNSVFAMFGGGPAKPPAIVDQYGKKLT